MEQQPPIVIEKIVRPPESEDVSGQIGLVEGAVKDLEKPEGGVGASES